MGAFVSLHNIHQLPVSRGKKTSDESLSVTLSSDDTLSVSLDADKGAGDTTADTLRVVVAADQWLMQELIRDQVVNAVAKLDNIQYDTANTIASMEKQDVHTSILNSIESNTGGAAGTLSTIDSKTPSLGQTSMAGSAPVVIASDQSSLPVAQDGSWLVDVGTLGDITGTITLPTGASTLAEQQTQTTALQSINAKFGSLGQKTMAGSAPVVIASDQTAFPVTIQNAAGALAYDTGVSNTSTLRTVLANRHESASTPLSVRITNGTSFAVPSPAGRTFTTSAFKDYAAGNVTTSAWTQLVASTGAAINYLMVTDQSGQAIELGVGAAASETRFALLPRGFSGVVPIQIASGSRITVRAVSGDATSGELVIAGYQ